MTEQIKGLMWTGSVQAFCPNCGHENTLWASGLNKDSPYTVVLCDPDEGGCDQEFVVKVILRPEVRTFVIVPDFEYKNLLVHQIKKEGRNF